MKVHFVGIGGAGMSVVADLLVHQGHRVSGSDRADSPTLAHLAGLGVQVYVGHAPTHVQGLGPQDLVVVSSAIDPGNPEVVAAGEQGVQVWHRSRALALAARGKRFVAVAGSHGKTTTSAMLAVALREVGADPSFAIGGRVVALGTGAHLGSGPAFVAEADESDGSFLNYSPQVVIVTNIEADHLDHYGTPAAYAAAFEEFAARLEPGGLVITSADDPGARTFAATLRSRGVRVQTYGAGEADVRIEITHLGASQSGARLTSTLGAVELDIAVPGEHNVANATAAWCAGVELGVDPAQMATALGAFTGTARRFEKRGSAGGVRVVDDYAHNPAKVAAAVATARGAAAGGRLIAVFQPHLYSRTRDFAQQFADSLADADEVLLAPIYPAREQPIAGVSSALIAKHLPGSEVIDRTADLAAAAARRAGPGDLIITIGAGDITDLPDAILDELGRR